MILEKTPLLYLILTNAGKPVYYSYGSEEDIVQYTAVIQAIDACFEETEKLNLIESKTLKFTISNYNKLILAAIDKQKRHPSIMKLHLNLLHSQILSVVTKQQLNKQLDLKPNMDIRPVIKGTKVFLNALCADFEQNKPWTYLNALESLTMRRHQRQKVNEILLSTRKDLLLYGLILVNGMLCSVVRPKQHSLHPPDLHLLNSMLFNTDVFSEGEHWVPICFPKFNPNGFLYAYITSLGPAPSPQLVLVSPHKQSFFDMQAVGSLIKTLIEPKLMQSIMLGFDPESRINPKTFGLEYFVYKNRQHVQFVQSQFGNDDLNMEFVKLQCEMLINKHQVSFVHLTTGSILGWVTPAFELYLHSNSTDKEDVSANARKLVSYLRKHEHRLFVVEGASF